MKLLIPSLCLFLFTSLPHQAASWSPELAMKVQTIGSRYQSIAMKSSGEIVPSPDGRLLAYTQTRAVIDTEKSEMLTQIFLAREGGVNPILLTQAEGSRAPSFGPDGRSVYFLSGRSGKRSISRIPVDGGEAEKLLDWEEDLISYHVSPDGQWIAFTGFEPCQETERARKERRDFRVVDEHPKRLTLWVISAATHNTEKRSARKLVDAPLHIVDFDWSPDSRFISFEHWTRSEPDFWFTADISEVEVKSGKLKALAKTTCVEAAPRYSPNGLHLAFLRSSDPPRWARDFRIALVERQEEVVRLLRPTHDGFGRGGHLLGWSADSTHLYFTETRGTRTGLYSMPLEGATESIYAPANGTLSTYGAGVSLNLTATHVGFSWESSEEPPEGFLLDLAKSTVKRVTYANATLPRQTMGETKRITWNSPDGLKIEGLLTLPSGFEHKKKYPLILIIHGGPMGVFTEMFIGRHGFFPEAMFSTKGYAVLRCNIRGSSGYGSAFRFANQNDWGGRDYEDLMAGVDYVISLGVADPKRMAVMGWSYGGYMTSWIIGHTDRFKAAVVGAGVTNLWSFTGTTDIPGFLPDYLSDEARDNLNIYLERSPMFSVKHIKTPTLILHGETDDRVPTSQGYELYNALKRQGVMTQMVVYPRSGHEISEPKFLLDIMRRHLQWVENYIGDSTSQQENQEVPRKNKKAA